MAALPFELAPAIAALPFVSFLIALLVGAFAPRLLPKGGAIPGILATGGSLLLSMWAFLTVSGGETYHEYVTWVAGAEAARFSLHLGVLVQPLSAMMLVIVSLVAFLV